MKPVAIKKRAHDAYFSWAAGFFVLVAALLAGCAGPKGSGAPERYDLGPVVQPQGEGKGTGSTVWLAAVHAPSSLDGVHMLYRLGYSNALQTRAYAQARWSMPVPELLEQRLRRQLSLKRAVLNPADGVLGRAHGVILRVDVEDFSQTFSAADHASAQVRVRATLSTWRGGVEHLLEQRNFQAVKPCTTADAQGGVQALSQATDQVLSELESWLDAAAVR